MNSFEFVVGRFVVPGLLPVCHRSCRGGTVADPRKGRAEVGTGHREGCFAPRPRRRKDRIAAVGPRQANVGQSSGDRCRRAESWCHRLVDYLASHHEVTSTVDTRLKLRDVDNLAAHDERFAGDRQ